MTRIPPQQAYAVLGVTPHDDFSTIRKAWVRLVKENHPDALCGDTEAATRRLARINDAYDSLRWHNPEKLRIHKEREDKRRQEARDRRARQDSLRQAQRSQAAPRDTADPARRDAERPAAETPVMQVIRPRTADRARQRYLEVQEICGKATEAALTRSA